MRILFVGDIVGKPGRNTFKSLIDELKREYEPDVVIANVENAADGFGITKKIYDDLSKYVDVLTTGNHVWDKEEIFSWIDDAEKILRPVNMPSEAPGCGFRLLNVKGVDVMVINAIGRIFMNPVDSPFAVLGELIDRYKDVKIKFVDFHAEATSEKQAIGWFLDGKVSAIVGTHTHVQTADERILPKGTAYISDTGMTGCHDGVLGFGYEEALERFIKAIPKRLKVCKTNLKLDGVVIDIDENGRASGIKRISKSFTQAENT
ncbi:TIGR00282 family metallophosphoesterase [Hippea alviniae]|uniref:TIGR00282 family metallophosphoesterase n=1 Tax=Hippea alviniae TaxID=1279027 RepID=UPI00047BC291